jgi:hypothetical protein
MSDPKTQADFLLHPKAIRERTRAIYDLCVKGGTRFKINPSKLDQVAALVLDVTRANYPDLNVPFHSRHNHLNAGQTRTSKVTGPQSQLELVLVSVLLDAGAGDGWKYLEPSTSKSYARSEGLAVASFDMFMQGAFSSKKEACADALGLKSLTPDDLRRGFQVTDANPLIGVEGRVNLLNQLGAIVDARKDVFPGGRPGEMFDFLVKRHGKDLRAVHVLDFVLRVFGPIWPSRAKLGGQDLGDVWSYAGLGPKDSFESYVPFHKLSQWLTYSLLVPVMEAGIPVSGVDELTGLAEYRNGGLMLDSGLLELRDPLNAKIAHAPHSEIIIEWRALTLVLLDEIAARVRDRLKMSATEFPLAKVLEGGTWHAGRKLAREKRPGGGPPLTLDSDGTVF